MSKKHHTDRRGGSQPLRVVELFAGVGGFRLGLSGKNDNSKDFQTVWFNQWEPGTKKQHAHDVYTSRFPALPGEERRLTNRDISDVVKTALRGEFKIPDHDVLVGGFPCQDYSVARTLSQAAGIVGKKGVLWWEIRNILQHKSDQRKPVKYIFLENVDRLLKSPTSRRGRDFAIMLATLADLGYAIEWRVINAADYGMPQRRRRVFIVGYHESTPLYRSLNSEKSADWMLRKGVIASAFPAASDTLEPITGMLEGTAADITENFLSGKKGTPFNTAGVLKGRKYYSLKVSAQYEGKQVTLGDILLNEKEVPREYFLTGDLKKWKYLKGAKNEPRKGANGFEFTYTEGPMAFPDPLNKPSRTIVTGEGGPTPSRFKHVIRTPSGKYRRLTPLELERLCMFPDHHTALEGVSDVRRAFFMGNALVVGVIERIGAALSKAHKRSLKSSANASEKLVLSPLSPKPTRPNRNRRPAKAA
jgi:DNA (cytosine-5)-methyltransferase 1